jgi:hypothetical protein
MRGFAGALYESVRLSRGDEEAVPEIPFPFALHVINPKGVTPQVEPVPAVPLYASDELPQALDFLHLGADEDSLWAAAGTVREPPEGKFAPLTVVRDVEGVWSQVLGSESTIAAQINGDVVNSIAPEPGTEGAWLALDSQQDALQPSPTATALVAHVAADGTVETQTLPSAGEIAQGIGPKGAAKAISCPGYQDCWMVTTQGWLFHLAPEGERTRQLDSSAAFSSLITFRPADEGLPQIVPDAPPPDTSGLTEAQITKPGLIEIPTANESKVRAPLLSYIHSRLRHGTTLELSFHLAVKARVKLVAKRKKLVVASTPVRTLAQGTRKLLLALNRRRWPTKLDLQTHALEPLPLVSTRLPGNNTVGTGMAKLPGVPTLGGSSWLVSSFGGSLP